MKKTTSSTMRQLGSLELKVMRVVWAKGTATVADVHEELRAKGDRLAYTTILTTMSKLEKKGFLEHETIDRAYHYKALVSDEGVRTTYLTDLIEKFFNGSPGMLVNHLLDSENLTDGELKKIREAIDEAKS